MIVRVEKLTGETFTAEMDPECGQDFCEHCGDCLSCYGGDPCVSSYGEHLWFMENSVYEARVSEMTG